MKALFFQAFLIWPFLLMAETDLSQTDTIAIGDTIKYHDHKLVLIELDKKAFSSDDTVGVDAVFNIITNKKPVKELTVRFVLNTKSGRILSQPKFFNNQNELLQISFNKIIPKENEFIFTIKHQKIRVFNENQYWIPPSKEKKDYLAILDFKDRLSNSPQILLESSRLSFSHNDTLEIYFITNCDKVQLPERLPALDDHQVISSHTQHESISTDGFLGNFRMKAFRLIANGDYPIIVEPIEEQCSDLIVKSEKLALKRTE